MARRYIGSSKSADPRIAAPQSPGGKPIFGCARHLMDRLRTLLSTRVPIGYEDKHGFHYGSPAVDSDQPAAEG